MSEGIGEKGIKSENSMKQIIECVPNFSEGRDKAVIDAIVAEIEKAGDVRLPDVDPGEATNRTVVTFVGEPEPVMEAALRAMKKAAELIDMTKHHGAHPRMGATDVMPLIHHSRGVCGSGPQARRARRQRTQHPLLLL